MFYKYEIRNNGTEDILYLYLTMSYEFSKEIGFNSSDKEITRRTRNFVKNNGIDYNGFNLYDYQVEGVKFGLNHHNFLLLDEQGLGKTLQIISLARYKKKHQGLKHCLIICGINSLKWNWVKEVAKFCSDERAIVLGSRKTKKGTNATLSKEETKLQIDNCPEEFFWIINIEKIRLSASEIKDKSGIVHHLNKQIRQGNLGMIVVDEIHKCKNTESSQGKGLLAFDKKADRVGMSGTILVNNPYVSKSSKALSNVTSCIS